VLVLRKWRDRRRRRERLKMCREGGSGVGGFKSATM
jgi:hypothetical protein